MKSQTETKKSKHSKLEIFSFIFGVIGILIAIYSIFSSAADKRDIKNELKIMEKNINDTIASSDSDYFLKLSEIIENKQINDEEKLDKAKNLHASYKEKVLSIVKHSLSSIGTEDQGNENNFIDQKERKKVKISLDSKPSIELGQDVSLDSRPKIELGQEVSLDSEPTIIVGKKATLNSSQSDNKSGTK